MKNTAIEKLSYTEVTKNISQAEYNQTQEEYILSKSPDKYMISLPVKVLMFEGAKDSSPFTYYFYTKLCFDRLTACGAIQTEEDMSE